MLTKEQATQLSDDLLCQESQRLTTRRNKVAHWLQPAYQFPELSAVEPWKQIRLIRTASTLADKCLPVLIAGFIFLTSLLAMAFFAPPEYQNFSSILGIFIFLGLPFSLIRRAFVRRHVVALLAAERHDE